METDGDPQRVAIFFALGGQTRAGLYESGPALQCWVFYKLEFLLAEADLFMSKSKFRKTFANLNLFNPGNINKNEEPIEERLKSEQFSLLKVKIEWSI